MTEPSPDLPLGSADLMADLAAMGVRPGDGLFVHSSLAAIGWVIGGPRGLIEALLGAVGPEGLIAMPGFSRDAYDPADGLETDAASRAHIRAQVPGFDPARTNVRAMGSVAEAFRAWPGVVRSPHPTSSVLMLGRDAAALSNPHPVEGWATGPESPWVRLADRPRMHVLLIGVGWNRASLLHAAESLAPHRRVRMREIKTGPGEAPWLEAPDVEDDLGRLFPLVGAAWEETGSVRHGRLGHAACRQTGYGDLLRFATLWIDRQNASDGVPAVDGT